MDNKPLIQANNTGHNSMKPQYTKFQPPGKLQKLLIQFLNFSNISNGATKYGWPPIYRMMPKYIFIGNKNHAYSKILS